MKIESTAFTQADLQGFLNGLLDHERMVLAGRLERASARLARLGPRIRTGPGEGGGDASGDGWSDHEVLAHIAVLSKFYGVLVHRIASGQLTEINLLANTNLRDVAGEQMARIETHELLRMALADHARTVKLLRTVEATALKREVRTETGGAVSADYLARFPLINHLEEHVEQLERSLG
ncbi:hypothetical protein EPN29_12835 [bacterium]|nr:MAG: hypothetical protein EPN29_12835 [bacterium]